MTASEHRVIVLYLHGHGPTRFLDTLAARSGQHPAAIGNDAIALTDALDISRAVLAGYDWGGREACGHGSARVGRLTANRREIARVMAATTSPTTP